MRLQLFHGLFLALFLLAGCSGAEDSLLFGSGTGDGKDGAPNDGASVDQWTPDAGLKDVQQPDVQPPDSGPPGKTPIYCGDTPPLSCTAPDEECCRQGFLQYTYSCEAPGTCVGTAIPCDKAQNCASLGMPGTVCCAHYTAQGQQTYVDAVECKPAGQCTQMNQSIVLCDPNTPTSCAANQKCTLSVATIPGYYFCK